jgi:hypothetical protein
MVTNTSDTSPDDIGKDTNFRENVRRQLAAKDSENGTITAADGPLIDLEPIAGAALRWMGGVVGSGLFLLGLFWMLAIIGFVLPWYAIFPLFAMFVGGWFLIGSYVTRKGRKRRH